MTVTSWSQLANRFTAMSSSIETGANSGVRDAALLLQAAVSVASGGYAGRPIVRTTVRYTRQPPTALVRMSSRKAHLLDHDTAGGAPILPGIITGHRLRAKALAFRGGDIVVTRSKKGHTSGKYMWEKGLDAAGPAMAKAVQQSVFASAVKAFGL